MVIDDQETFSSINPGLPLNVEIRTYATGILAGKNPCSSDTRRNSLPAFDFNLTNNELKRKKNVNYIVKQYVT